MGKTLLLSEQDVKDLLPLEDIVKSVEKTFRGLGDGTVINPTKVNLDLGEIAPYPPYKGFMNAMPAYIGYSDIAGLKWAGGNLGERKERGISYCSSLIFLVNPHVNNFIAVLDGAYITNTRTGAQTAVSLKYLLKDKKPLRIGLYGAGVQGHNQIRAISKLFDIEEVRVYDINQAVLKKYQEDLKDVVKGRIIPCSTPEEAASGEVIICVTQAQEPYLKKEWIKPGTIVFPMGSYQECEDDVILGAKAIVVDHVGQALHRGALAKLSEEGKITKDSIYGTIGELVAGKKAAPEFKDGYLVCIPIGTGAMDIGCASLVYQRAVEKGGYQSFDFGTSSQY